MRIKNKIFIALFIMVMCLPMVLNLKTTIAVTIDPKIPMVKKEELPTNRGEQVTGDDIVNTAFYLGRVGFTYSNVGTCTGFVVRTLRYLEIDAVLVSGNGNIDRFYNSTNWDVPGSHGSPFGPQGFKNQYDRLVREGRMEYITEITPSQQNSQSYIDSLQLKNGDLLVTPETDDKDGHVAFCVIYEGHAKAIGAGGTPDIHIGNIKAPQENKEGPVYVYRLKTASGKLKILKNDSHNQPLANITMRIVGQNYDQYHTTDVNGEINIESLIAGEYKITEIDAPSNLIKIESEIPLQIEAGKEKRITITNDYKRGSSRIHKMDALEGEKTRGDATFEDAEYTLYAKTNITEGVTPRYSANQPIGVYTTNKEGYTEWIKQLPLGEYYWLETKAPNGYLLDKDKHYFSIEVDDAQEEKGSKQEVTSNEIPVNGRVTVVKHNGDGETSDKSPAAGAKLRITLISSVTNEDKIGIHYDVTLDDNGYGEFKDEEFLNAHPDETCSIPFGKYRMTELAESEGSDGTHYFIQPVVFEITEEEHQKEVPFRLDDEPTDLILRIVKKDDTTKETVKKAGAKFVIWDVEAGKMKEFMEPLSHKPFTVLETTNEGYVNTPTELTAGKTYVIYEIEAPDGYCINPKYALPEKESDYGKVNGYRITVNKMTADVPMDIIYDEENNPILIGEMEDSRLMVKLTVHKTGERFTEVAQDSVTYKTGDNANDKRTEKRYTPVFKEQPLPGVVFNVITTERVLNPNKNGTYLDADTIVDTITTDAEGNATTIDLFPGTYRLQEVQTPEGYVAKENIEPITLTNEDKNIPVKEFNVDLANDRQRLGLTFPKSFEKVKFITGEKVEQKATFAVYANEDITSYDGKVKIPKDGLVDLVEIEGNDNVTSKIDLPEGKYYAKEVYVSYPYTPYGEKIEFSLVYNNNNQPYVVIEGKEIINTYETSSISLIKISSSSMQSVVMKGKEIDKSKLDEEISKVIEELNGKTEEQVKQYLKDNKIITVAGATYGVYTDAECKNILKILNEETGAYEEAKIVTDESGMIKLEGLPVGNYYVKELEAPNGYELSKQIANVNLTLDNRDEMVFDALVEDSTVGYLFTKIDAFNGEEIPNCKFDIFDEDGNSILELETAKGNDIDKTNDRGKAIVPLDLFEEGKTYYYKEISAPEQYVLNDEVFSFVARFNEKGEFVGERKTVENTRKHKELRVLKVDEKTGKPLQGCVFSIVELDENGEIKLNVDGNPTYLVENAVTDENGEYLIEKAYYGTYKFTEVQAPEGYELNEKDMEGYVFTIDKDSADRIDFIITNTGDIAVIAIAVVAVVCVLGIAFVIVRNKKARK